MVKFYQPFSSMFDVVFKERGFILPFNTFEQEVVRYLDLEPSQFHPNCWDFIRVFNLYVNI